MKNLLYIAALVTAVNFGARAELKDVVEGGVIRPAVAFETNDLSTRDLQEVLGVKAFQFKVRRSSATNGLAVYVEIVIEGKTPTTLAHLDLDRATLENEHAGDEIPVLVAVNPVGSLDGEGTYSAKKWRCFLREAGVTTSGTGDNPFYKSKNGIVSWGQYPAKESATAFKFMESRPAANAPGSKIEMRVRFHEF